jgi:hypothetical protein
VGPPVGGHTTPSVSTTPGGPTGQPWNGKRPAPAVTSREPGLLKPSHTGARLARPPKLFPEPPPQHQVPGDGRCYTGGNYTCPPSGGCTFAANRLSVSRPTAPRRHTRRAGRLRPGRSRAARGAPARTVRTAYTARPAPACPRRPAYPPRQRGWRHRAGRQRRRSGRQGHVLRSRRPPTGCRHLQSYSALASGGGSACGAAGTAYGGVRSRRRVPAGAEAAGRRASKSGSDTPTRFSAIQVPQFLVPLR